MAIIDELRKEYKERNPYASADCLIKDVVSILTEEIRSRLGSKKDICICGTVYRNGFVFRFGLPRDSEGWYAWKTYNEDEAKYIVEHLKETIIKEFRPQSMTVRYDSHGFFKEYYTLYVGVTIKNN